MTTANEAFSHAQSAHDKINAHEDLCAERYAHIHTAMDGVKDTIGTVLKLLAWGGSTFFFLLIAVLGFLATRAISGNDAEVETLRQQVEMITVTDHK